MMSFPAVTRSKILPPRPASEASIVTQGPARKDRQAQAGLRDATSYGSGESHCGFLPLRS